QNPKEAVDENQGQADAKQDTGAPADSAATAVLCVAGRSALDEAAAAMLVQVLRKRGVSALLQPLAPPGSPILFPLEARNAQLICLSYFGAVSKPAHVRYLIRRLKRSLPRARFLACFWMLGNDPNHLEEWRQAVG